MSEIRTKIPGPGTMSPFKGLTDRDGADLIVV